MSKPFVDITGKVFERWFVVSREENNKWGQARFLCRCLCGTEKIVLGYHLRKEKSTSCGCYHKEITSLPEGESNFRTMYKGYERHAQKKNVSFELSFEEFRALTQQVCHYCGANGTPFAKMKRANGHYIGNGIDRKDNSLGYTLENSLSCCSLCNKMKHTVCYNLFISQIQIIAKHMTDGG